MNTGSGLMKKLKRKLVCPTGRSMPLSAGWHVRENFLLRRLILRKGIYCILNLIILSDKLMDKNIIGSNAGIIYHLLSNGKRWNYEDLKDASGLSDRDLNAAIGWLAREDKIFFESDKSQGKDFLFISSNVYF